MSKSMSSLKAKHPDKIRDWYKDSDGYWINLKPGWQFWDAHCVHEWKIRDVFTSFAQVRPCECDECGKAVKP